MKRLAGAPISHPPTRDRPLRVLTIQNSERAPLGLIGTALERRGVLTDIHLPSRGDVLPDDTHPYAGLIVLGGAQNALDDANHPYYPALLTLIRRFVDRERPVLGICLGAQIMARALGAKVTLNGPFEFGYTQISPLPAASSDPVCRHLSTDTPLMQWHSDTFSLPEGAVHLACSAQYPMQGFRMRRNAYALQFHFEVTPSIVADWIACAPPDVSADPSLAERVGQPSDPRHLAANRLGHALADAWIDLLA